MKTKLKDSADLWQENAELRARLDEAEETLRAIRAGEVDAMVMGGRVYSLQTADTPYRVILETMNEGAATLMTDGTVLYANERLAALLGRPLEGVLGYSLRHFVTAGSWPAFDALLVSSQLGSAKVECDLRRGDESSVPVQLSCRALNSEDLRTLSVVVTDLTERTRVETELRYLNRVLRTVSAGNLALVRARTESELLNEICQVIVNEGGYRMAWVGYAEHDAEKTVRPVAHAGVEEGYVAQTHITWADTARGRGPTGNAIRTGRPCTCRDMRTDPDFAPWRDEALKRGYASSVVLPLVGDGGVFGTLSIYAPEPGAFDTDELRLLSELADELAYGIQAHRMREKREHAEEALRLASAYHRSLIEASLDPLVTIGADGKITDVNEASAQVTGVPREQLIGTDFSNYFTEPGRARAGYQQVFREGAVRDYPLAIRHASGRITEVLYNASVYRDDKGEVLGVFAAARDITERKRAEAALQEAQSLRAEAEKLGKVGGWEFDIDTKALTWTEEVFYIHEVALTYQPTVEQGINFYAPASRPVIARAVERAIEHGEPFDVELEIITAKGNRRSVHSIGKVDPTRRKVLGFFQDITAQKHAEEEIQRYAEDLKRSNQELEHFAYVASHDLQEPLRTVSSFSQLLARRYQGRLDRDADDFINFIVSGATRMQTLINDLLTFSRVGTRGKPFAPVDCAAVLAHVVTSLETAFTETGAVLTHDTLPRLLADETQLGQLFQNLISNAIKFRRLDAPPRIHVSAEQQPHAWQFSVRDNCIGIDPQYFDRIFIIFQRLHNRDEYPGTGIGLAVCKKIVERHGGRMWVKSAPGQGATFYFTLPNGNASS